MAISGFLSFIATLIIGYRLKHFGYWFAPMSISTVIGGCPKIVIFSQIEECEKNYRRHIVDIPRIIF